MTNWVNRPNPRHEERWKIGVRALEEHDGPGAVFVYEALAKDGCGAALAQLGRIYESGIGSLQADFDTAVRWYKLSIEVVDEASSHLALARIYMQEPDRDPGWTLTFYHLDLLDTNDVPAASFGLGLLHEHGMGVAACTETARTHYERAAALGHVEARFRLAKLAFDEAPFRNFFSLLKVSREIRRIQRVSPLDPRLGLEYPAKSYIDVNT